MENEVISESGMQWINEKADMFNLDVEDIKAKYVAKAAEFEQSGMKMLLPTEELFAEAVCSALNAEIQREKGVPKMDIEYAPLGHYPERLVKGGRESVEMIGIVKDEATGKKKFSRLSAWEDEAVKKMSVEFGKGYTGTVKYISDIQLEKAHICGVEGFTNFAEANIDWATPEKVNELIAKAIPHVKLGEVAKHPSKTLKSSNEKYYPDSLDLKYIMGQVVDFKYGQREDGSYWAKYSMVDSTFNDDKLRSFPVWVDKDLALKINAGKDSFIRLIGYITEKQDKDTGDFVYDMTACAIQPLSIANGIDQPDEKILERQAQNSVSEEESGISIEDL